MAGHMPHWSRIKAKSRRVRVAKKTPTHNELREAMRSLGAEHPKEREIRENMAAYNRGLWARMVL